MSARQTQLSFWGLHKAAMYRAWLDIRAKLLGNLLTVLVIALVLSLPATFYLIAKNIQQVTSQWERPTQITVYINGSESSSKVNTFTQQLRNWEQIQKVSIVTPDAGLAEFKAEAGLDNVLSVLDKNPLPYALIILPNQEWQVVDKAQQIVDSLNREMLVEDVRMDSDWLQRLQAAQTLVISLGAVLGSLMLAAIFLIIGNTLRLQILSHKKEIQVMKLVGATDGFILRPYLYMGALFGAAGAVISFIIISCIVMTLSGSVANLANLYAGQFSLSGLQWDEVLLVLLIALLLGWSAARIAALKHLKEIEPE